MLYPIPSPRHDERSQSFKWKVSRFLNRFYPSHATKVTPLVQKHFKKGVRRKGDFVWTTESRKKLSCCLNASIIAALPRSGTPTRGRSLPTGTMRQGSLREGPNRRAYALHSSNGVCNLEKQNVGPPFGKNPVFGANLCGLCVLRGEESMAGYARYGTQGYMTSRAKPTQGAHTNYLRDMAIHKVGWYRHRGSLPVAA
ncbi:hypothetical protein Tco_0974761 [Tanacetum coccineum]|uniref:Uncharacterized protein n=1 Tax=Tanacetum coccineum TaxID=301880 RepID=A0ABQ5ECF8_9ASTR